MELNLRLGGKMSSLPGDLLKIIATYSPFDPSIALLTISGELARMVYDRAARIWRDKAKYETRGVTLDPEKITDWLLYYRMVRTTFYGRFISPYPIEGGITLKRGIDGIVCAFEDQGLVGFADTNRVLNWFDGERWCSIELTRLARRIAFTFGSRPAVYVLLESDQLIKIDRTSIAHAAKYISDIGTDSTGIWCTTRDGLSTKPIGDASIPIVHQLSSGLFITVTGQIGGFDDGGQGEDSRFISGFNRDVGREEPGATLITTNRSIRIFDPYYPDLLELARYAEYAGRIETCTANCIIVSPT